MKIVDRAINYSEKYNDNKEIRREAYIEGAHETLQILIDRLRRRHNFCAFTLEDVAKVINIMRNGECDYK